MSEFVTDVSDQSFEVEVLQAGTPVLVDFWAAWCGPCRMLAPTIDNLAAEFDGRLKVVKVNVDDDQGLARRYDAMSIPTMLVIRDGQVVDRIVGAMPKAELEAQLAPYIGAAR